MTSAEEKYSPILDCPNCMNKVLMKIVAEYSQVQFHHQEHPIHFEWNAGPIYRMLLCPACEVICFSRINYNDAFDPTDWTTEILYPMSEKTPQGLPSTVSNAYQAALKVRGIDANFFAVGLRRVLELVCIDRQAEGRALHEQLTNLARRGEIPERLADMAHGLRQLGNIGAHASEGALTKDEIPFLDKLCQAILEYVYYAPHLLGQVEQRLSQIKGQGSG